MGTVLCTVILISLVNLLTDIAQSLVDPRVRIT
jgi:ABC-type dipeptide/oligopeptide/nickel transport system permease component